MLSSVWADAHWISVTGSPLTFGRIERPNNNVTEEILGASTRFDGFRCPDLPTAFQYFVTVMSVHHVYHSMLPL